ncbi:unnamed protein product [Tuber aestivum]|uniref:CFEM domain-containing protein n=1 Tax=Tuber aestivum TaxID=59557 RepID=A0A292Q497_9PEZI|nr:unnamed protein product [Tuber aestivum]
MKTSLIASILGAAVMVVAQADLTQLPTCAMSCVTTAMAKVNDCSNTDIPCMCKNRDFITELTNCLPTACTNPDDITKSVAVAQTLCGSDLPSGAISSVQAGPTGNATTGTSSGNATKTSGSTSGRGSGSASSTGGSGSGSAGSGAGNVLVPGGFAAAAIFACLFAL